MAQAVIPFSGGDLRFVNTSDYSFCRNLFSVPDVKKYYVLRDDHARDLYAFTVFMAQAMERGTGINYIIENNMGVSVGLISSELIRSGGQVMWNVGYAVLPNYRNQGYASRALSALTNYLTNNFSVQLVSLDICDTNKDSERVAIKCGFKKPSGGPRMAYIDPERIELGPRFKWFKEPSGRIAIFNQAMRYARAKDYSTAIEYYKKAIAAPYVAGTPHTDAQIYSNMGMCYSSIRQYRTAYDCLITAKRLGLTNTSIEKELSWLKNNVGLG